MAAGKHARPSSGSTDWIVSADADLDAGRKTPRHAAHAKGAHGAHGAHGAPGSRLNEPVFIDADRTQAARAADLPDGGLFCSVINLGVDPLYDIPLVVKSPVQSVEMMNENGDRIPCAFHMEGDRVVIDETVHSLNAACLFLH